MNHAIAHRSSQQRRKITKPSNRVSVKHSDSVKEVLRPKLKIGEADDRFEQEANQVAEQVMRIPDPISQPSSSRYSPAFINNSAPPHQIIHRACAACAKDEELVQKKSNGSTTPEVSPSIHSRIQSLQGAGKPLSRSERRYFEPRFRADFSNVRVHNDSRAANAAQSINARAFTVGNNVVFAAGEYNSESFAGKKLFAHELTHILQQNNRHEMIQRYTAAEKATCPCLDWTLTRMFLTGRSMAVGGALTGRTYAMSFMDHFLNESGSDRYVEFSDYNADSGGQHARDTVDGNIRNHFISEAQSTPCDGQRTTTTTSSTPGHFDHGTDLFYAMGAFGLRAEASGTVNKVCDDDSNCASIQAEYQTQYRVNDLYDWKKDPGGCTPATGETGCSANMKTVTLPVLGLICDECLNRLVIHGWAGEFMAKVRGRGDFEIDSPCNVSAPTYANTSFSDNARNDP